VHRGSEGFTFITGGPHLTHEQKSSARSVAKKNTRGVIEYCAEDDTADLIIISSTRRKIDSEKQNARGGQRRKGKKWGDGRSWTKRKKRRTRDGSLSRFNTFAQRHKTKSLGVGFQLFDKHETVLSGKLSTLLLTGKTLPLVTWGNQGGNMAVASQSKVEAASHEGGGNMSGNASREHK